jgi:hypothetical protein
MTSWSCWQNSLRIGIREELHRDVYPGAQFVEYDVNDGVTTSVEGHGDGPENMSKKEETMVWKGLKVSLRGVEAKRGLEGLKWVGRVVGSVCTTSN